MNSLFVKWIKRSVSERGLVRTAKVAGNVALDLSFDLWYGTETMRWVWSDNLGANSKHDINAVGYRATRARPLQKLIDKLELSRDYTFIDLGSGKGRVLLLAAQMGFKDVIGVEFSPKLCAIANNNVCRFTRQVKVDANISVVQADVATYQFPPHPTIFYAYNPFDYVVMNQWIANLRQSLEQYKRRVWFIYNTPLYGLMIQQSRLFREMTEFEIGGTYFEVYRSI